MRRDNRGLWRLRVEEGGTGATGWVYRFGCAGERWSVVIEPDHGAWSGRCLAARDLRAALREARAAIDARAWKAWGWRAELEYHDMGARWVLELFHDRMPRRLRMKAQTQFRGAR